MMGKAFWFVILLLMLGIFLAACGGETVTPAEEETAGEMEPAEEAAAKEPAEEVAAEEPAEDAVAEEPAEEDPAEDAAGEDEGEVIADPAAEATVEIDVEPIPIPNPAEICQAVSPAIDRIPEGNMTATEKRLFWTICLDEGGIEKLETKLADEEIGSFSSENSEGQIEWHLPGLVRKQIDLWHLENGGKATLLHRKIFDLDAILECGETELTEEAFEQRLVKLLDDRAVPLNNGCYLVVDDDGLSAQAGTMGLEVAAKLEISEGLRTESEIFLGSIEHGETTGTQFEGGYYVGENVRLDVVFKTSDEGNRANALFSYPQYYEVAEPPAKNAVQAFETIGDPADQNNRLATWQVRADGSNQPIYDPSNPYESDGYRLLLARQDQDTQTDALFFEYLLNVVPIRDREEDNSSHYFNTGQEYFYIGYMPEIDPTVLNDSAATLEIALTGDSPEENTLHGSIRLLMFDPNASCWSC